MDSRIAVLVAAAGAGWEAQALRELSAAGPAVVVLKRCVDLPDLLASAMTGQAQVALVADDLPGVDGDSVAHLRRCGLGVVMVTGDEVAGPQHRLGVEHVLAASELPGLPDVVRTAGSQPEEETASFDSEDVPFLEQPMSGRVLAVWGPAGAPGRTTVAVGVAAELASRGRGTFLVDADPYGGTVAQHLGLLDEVSGLLAAARLANAGQLDRERLATCARQVDPTLRVLTGLPRADRWTEVRPPAFEQVLDLAGTLAGDMVVDTGFCLEEDANAAFGGTAPQRNAMTLAALEHADEVITVGSADPVGLARLARGLVELTEAVPGCSIRVLVNRSRSSLGWRAEEITAMLGDFVTADGVHLLPDDRPAADRAIVAGKSLVELGDTALRRGISQVVDAVTGDAVGARPRPKLFRRQA